MRHTRLKPPPPIRGVDNFALAFLHFKHEHEGWWEVGEGLMIGVVFCLEFLHLTEASHITGLISHVLVSVLLLLKLVSIAAHEWSKHYKDQA